MSGSGPVAITPAEVFDAAERSLSIGDLPLFDQHVDRLLRIAPYWLEALLLAAASFEPRDPPRAEKLYAQALKTKTLSAEAAAGLARCRLAQTGDVELSLLKHVAKLGHGRDVTATLTRLCAARQWSAAGVAYHAGKHLTGVIALMDGAPPVRHLVLRSMEDTAATTLGELLEEVRPSSRQDMRVPLEFDAPNSVSREDHGLISFRAAAPKPGRYLVFLESEQGTITGCLLPAIMVVKAAETAGEIWWCHGGVVCGWLEVDEDHQPDLTVECEPPCEVLSVSYAPLSYAGSEIESGRKLYGFAALLPQDPNRTVIRVRAPGHRLTGSPLHVMGPYGSALHSSLRSFALAPPDWHLMPRVRRAFPAHAGASQPVDVIIPVYRGHAETQRCIESVRSSRNARVYHLVIINDASPSPALTVYLRALAGEPQVTLIENARNKGFVATVNAGMRLNPARDVVLLNSDTQVTDGWLDRLTVAADDSTDIATVTPLSNSATILSYPSLRDSNPLPSTDDLTVLDRIFAEGRQAPLEIPTAVGFCMFIRRACLDDAGLFDEVNFGRGYGEENEFCLRATARGWRHVCAPNLLVGHQGSVSFGDEIVNVQRQRLSAIEGAFPGYSRYIERFIVADPLLEVRRAADVARLANQVGDQPALLMVAPDFTGGMTEHVATICRRLTDEGARCFILTAVRDHPTQPYRARLKVFDREKEYPNLLFELPFDLDFLAQSLRRLKIRQVHVHHFLGLPWTLTTVADRLDLPFDVTVHDYGWACPRVTMVGATGRYCGEPDLAGCEHCIASTGERMDEKIGVRALRQRSRRFLAAARQVFVPSADVANRVRRYFPETNIAVRPHPDDGQANMDEIYGAADSTTVAVIGAINADKGYDVLLACARDAAARALPIRFVVIGFTQDDDPLLRTGRVTITGRYDPDELPDLLRRHKPVAGWVPSVCPETWSLALSHILAAGLWPIAFDLGAPAARLRALNQGDLLPLDADAPGVNDTLVAILARAPHMRASRGDAGIYDRMLDDYYCPAPELARINQPALGTPAPLPRAAARAPRQNRMRTAERRAPMTESEAAAGPEYRGRILDS